MLCHPPPTRPWPSTWHTHPSLHISALPASPPQADIMLRLTRWMQSHHDTADQACESHHLPGPQEGLRDTPGCAPPPWYGSTWQNSWSIVSLMKLINLITSQKCAHADILAVSTSEYLNCFRSDFTKIWVELAWRNGLPCDGSQFDCRWERYLNQTSRPSQGTINGGAVSKWPRCQWNVKRNQPKKNKYGLISMVWKVPNDFERELFNMDRNTIRRLSWIWI